MTIRHIVKFLLSLTVVWTISHIYQKNMSVNQVASTQKHNGNDENYRFPVDVAIPIMSIDKSEIDCMGSTIQNWTPQLQEARTFNINYMSERLCMLWMNQGEREGGGGHDFIVNRSRVLVARSRKDCCTLENSARVHIGSAPQRTSSQTRGTRW